jgi:hypothetical protein
VDKETYDKKLKDRLHDFAKALVGISDYCDRENLQPDEVCCSLSNLMVTLAHTTTNAIRTNKEEEFNALLLDFLLDLLESDGTKEEKAQYRQALDELDWPELLHDMEEDGREEGP